MTGDHISIDTGDKHYYSPSPLKYPPIQLPPPPLRFRDRKRELNHLLSHLQPGSIYTICAPGGMGKTDLVSKALHTLTDGETPPVEFPDGIVFHTFYKQSGLDIALEHIAYAYGEELKPTPLEAARRALSGRQAILVLDGAEDAENLDVTLSIRGRCCVIITSRDRSHLMDCGKELLPLKESEGLALIADWGMEYARNPNAARRVWELVGGLTIALRIAGQYMSSTQTPIQEYIRLLESSPLSETLQIEERRLQSVSVLLGYCLDQVSEDARSVFATSSLFAFSSFPRQLLSVALSFDDSRLAYALGELVRFGLFQRFEEAYQLTHILLHIYAIQETAPPSSALENLIAYFEQFTKKESEKGLLGYSRLGKARSHILFFLDHLENAKKWHNLLDLANAIDIYLDIQGHTFERYLVCQSAIHASRELEDKLGEGTWFKRCGSAYLGLGQFRKSIDIYQKSLRIAREIAHKQLEGQVLCNIGLAYNYLSEFDKAIEHSQSALDISRQILDRNLESNVLNNLGISYFDLGDSHKALMYYKQALKISRNIGDHKGESIRLVNLGSVFEYLDEPRKAIQYYQQSLDISRQIGFRSNEGTCLGNLGLSYFSLGEYNKAIDYFQQTLKIARQIGNCNLECKSLFNLGKTHIFMDEPQKAIDFFQEALEISRQIGNRRSEGIDLVLLGFVYADLGDLQTARLYYEQALAIFEVILPPDHSYVLIVRQNLQHLKSQIHEFTTNLPPLPNF